MKLDIVTCLWGKWHIGAFGKIALPTLLAPGNLPAASGFAEIRYRFFTTAPDRKLIETLPLFEALSRTVKTEIVTPVDEPNPDPARHVEWYHLAIADAKAAGAVVAFSPPDVVWSDGTFAAMARAMARGYKGCAMPYLRVVSETCIGEVGRLSHEGGRPLGLDGRATVALGLRHLHPLSAAVLLGAPHTRPTLEVLFPVKGEGMVLSHAVRELFAFDPSRMKPSYLWYAEDIDDPDDVHFVRSSDEMMMLSLAPLLKDFSEIGIYIPDRSPAVSDPAASARHPLNDTPLTLEFMRRPVRLAFAMDDEAKWRGAERRAAAFFRRSMFHYEAMGVVAAMRKLGCGLAGDIAAWGARTAALARAFPDEGPYAVFAPTDAAFAAAGPDFLERLVFDKGPDALRAFFAAHIARIGPDGVLVRSDGLRLREDGDALFDDSGRRWPVVGVSAVRRHKVIGVSIVGIEGL